VLKNKILLVGREEEGLRDDVKVLETAEVLHAFDVLVETIFAGQLAGSETDKKPI
jgi:hypothetical protein